MSLPRMRWIWPVFCAGLFAGTVGSQLFLNEPADAGPTPAGTPFTQLQQQVNDLAETVAAQAGVISALRERMVFDDDHWLGWREMILVGETQFIDAEGDTRVNVCSTSGPIVQIRNTLERPERYALDARGHVSIRPEIGQTAGAGLEVYGTLEVEGPEVVDALRVRGKTKLESHQPPYESGPALQVIGPALYQPSNGQDVTVRFNDDFPRALSAYFIGPVAFRDTDGPRRLFLFASPENPISYDIFIDGNGYTPFQVKNIPGTREGSVFATEFIEIPIP